MKKIKVLCVCSKGKNRSKYLAEYLSSLGYKTDFCGVSDEAKIPCNNKKLREANLVICVRPKQCRLLFEKFYIKKPIIILRVKDTPSKVAKSMIEKKMFTELRILRERVHENLRKAIASYLPLEDYLKEWNS